MQPHPSSTRRSAASSVPSRSEKIRAKAKDLIRRAEIEDSGVGLEALARKDRPSVPEAHPAGTSPDRCPLTS
jgi:hypothetical protein